MKYSAKTAIAVALTALLAGCGGQEETAQVQDTLVVAQGSDAKTLDPHATNDQPSSRVAAQIYSQLVTVDETMKIVPDLAVSWESVDANTTVFKLREGVKFHNGEELKASDVKFTLDRMVDSPTVAHIAGTIETVDVIDDYTVKITTSQPFGPLLYHLTHTASSILNEKAVTSSGDNYGQQPVGTGPYKFADWAAGDTISLTAHNDYYDGVQAVPNVKFRNIVEGTNRTIALETGEADIAYDIEPIDKETVKNHSNLQLLEGEALSVAYYGFNTTKPPFDNVKVRQAMGYAINSQDIIDAVVTGSGTATNSSISPRVFGYSPKGIQYQQDYEKARQLLTEAGYPNGFKTTLWTNDNPVRVQIAQVLQAQVREIGIDMSIEVVEWGAFLDGTSRGEHDTYILSWVTVTGDADYGLFPLFNSATHGSAGNRSFYTNEKMDELLETARSSVSQEERLALYEQVQVQLQEELPHLPIYVQVQNAGMKKNVKGFQLAPAGHHKLKGISFEG